MIEEGVEAAILRRAAGTFLQLAPARSSSQRRLGTATATRYSDPSWGIRTNDRIVVSTLSKNYDYEVTGTAIVSPNDVGVLASTPGQNTLTLVTCYPFYYVGSAPDRFIVKARQVSPELARPQVAEQVPETLPETPQPPVPVAPARLEPTALDRSPGPRKVRFEVLKSHSRELAPGISIGLTGTDVAGRRLEGWMWVMPDRRTIQLRHQSAGQPIIFYRDGGKRELVITTVAANSVSGYLIVPADRQLHARR